MSYVGADKYLSVGARLGFVINRSVFQSELGGWHFRRFRLPNDKDVSVEAVHDLDSLKPFRGQAANVTSTFFLQANAKTTYPVPWIKWLLEKGSRIDEATEYADVQRKTERRRWVARPIDSEYAQAPWVFGERRAIDALLRLTKPSYYAKFAREGINTRGANGVYFLDASNVAGKLFVRNRAEDGDDHDLASIKQTIEPDFIYPLLRGKDVRKWAATPSSYAIIPHDSEAPVNPVVWTKLPKKTQEFFARFEAKLRSRKKFRNFDPAGNGWFGLYSVLAATFARYKVVWREMAVGAVAASVKADRLPTGERKVVVPDHKLFIIPCSCEPEADFICAILNSSISNYLVLSYALATGISTHILDRLPIPLFDDSIESHRELAETARGLVAATVKDGESDMNKMALDASVARVFAVADDDLAAIQRGLRELKTKK
jgi:hypothetical protein